jgi:hypothetical protein
MLKVMIIKINNMQEQIINENSYETLRKKSKRNVTIQKRFIRNAFDSILHQNKKQTIINIRS